MWPRPLKSRECFHVVFGQVQGPDGVKAQSHGDRAGSVPRPVQSGHLNTALLPEIRIQPCAGLLFFHHIVWTGCTQGPELFLQNRRALQRVRWCAFTCSQAHVKPTAQGRWKVLILR